jgi:NAD(P)-dependent dehydrogenase (short-subunit alcohol dehydrogenase family)
VKLLTQAMTADLARDGIRVNAVAPGVIETAMTESTRNDPERLGRFMARIPAAGSASPRRSPALAVFLASDLASYVNGVTLPADGAGRRCSTGRRFPSPSKPIGLPFGKPNPGP